MKRSIFPILALSLIAGSSLCQEKIDIEKEKEAIKAVIEEEANAYRSKDIDRHLECFVQDETLTGVINYPTGGLFIGFENISQKYKDRVDNNPEPTDRRKAKDFKYYNIKVYKDCAWAVFEEHFVDENDSISSGNRQIKFLEKEEDEWKIALMCTFPIDDSEGW